MLEWKSMMYTIVSCIWLKSYCLSCVRSVASSLSSSKAVFLLTEPARQSTSWNETPAFFFPDFLSPSSTNLNPVDYKDMGRNVAVGLASLWRRWTEAWSMSLIVSSKVSSVMQLTSGTNVCTWICTLLWVHTTQASLASESGAPAHVCHVALNRHLTVMKGKGKGKGPCPCKVHAQLTCNIRYIYTTLITRLVQEMSCRDLAVLSYDVQ